MQYKILFFFILGIQMANAQVKNFTYKGEFAISDLKSIEEMMPLMPGIGSPMKDLLNEQSIKAFMMTPRKVGSEVSTNTYGIAACMEYYLNFNQNYKENLSPDYISLNVESDGKKHKIEDGLQFVANTGTVSAGILPYDSKVLNSSVNATQKHKIKHYLVLFREITAAKQKLFELKKALTRGNPVLTEISVNQEFMNLNNAKYWSPATGSKTNITQTVIAVGFDEDRKAIEVQNFNGTTWGNNGYIWISYDDFSKLSQNAYVLVVE